VIFVDTSAFYSLLDRDDANHATAGETWQRLLAEDSELVTSNYILVETTALVRGRLGMAAARDFHENITPLLAVEWIDRAAHEMGVAAVLTANRRRLSLVDCVSFTVCRRLNIARVFAFDPHFAEQGFLPPYASTG
jgi:predicted nucleic acid-binding protein